MFASCKSITIFFACVIPYVFLFTQCNNVKTGREGKVDTIDKGVVMALKDNDFNIMKDYLPTVEDVEEEAHNFLGGEPPEDEKKQLSEKFAKYNIAETLRGFRMIYEFCDKNEFDWDNATLITTYYFPSMIDWHERKKYAEENTKTRGYLSLYVSDKKRTINILLDTVSSVKHRYIIAMLFNPFSDNEFEQVRWWRPPEKKKSKDVEMSKIILNNKTNQFLLDYLNYDRYARKCKTENDNYWECKREGIEHTVKIYFDENEIVNRVEVDNEEVK